MKKASSSAHFFPADSLDDYKPKPKFPFDDDYRFELEDYEEICPNCRLNYQQHTPGMARACAYLISKIRRTHKKIS